MINFNQKETYWIIIIAILTIVISILHYSTPTMNWQYHLIYMQSYFIPILIAAFQFGIRGGIISAAAVTILYLPHIMLHWGGFVEQNLVRFLQIILFNVIGYLTGLKSQKEKDEKNRYQKIAKELELNYDKLTELEEQLRQSDRLAVVGELTASLAHEVRNPLGAIRGAVEIIRDEVSPDSKQYEFATILIDETKRLNEVVENYLNLAKKQKKEDVSYQINEIIQSSVLLISNQAKKNNIRIIVNGPDFPIQLMGDQNDLQQILINLILNAIESIKEDGEILIDVEQISSGESEIESNELKISVNDTGSGLNEEEIDKIFQPFYTSKKTGSGLGLAIVKRIADSNNWKINIESVVDVGTKFVLMIPINKN